MTVWNDLSESERRNEALERENEQLQARAWVAERAIQIYVEPYPYGSDDIKDDFYDSVIRPMELADKYHEVDFNAVWMATSYALAVYEWEEKQKPKRDYFTGEVVG